MYLTLTVAHRWNFGDIVCWGCVMSEMWDVPDVGCSGCGMLEMWDVRDVGCSGCGMFGMWDVGCLLGCGMLIYKMPTKYTHTYTYTPTDTGTHVCMFVCIEKILYTKLYIYDYTCKKIT